MKQSFRIIFSMTIMLVFCSATIDAKQKSSVNKANIKTNLTESTAQAIIFMREEEKLARDVYLFLGKKWQLAPMEKIASSEQRHMDALKNLIVKFKLTDPVKNDTPGQFKSKHFKQLYEKLIAQGQRSVVDALKVGATIEDLDISDLDTRIAKIDNPQVVRVFNNLNRGSRNHLRAFIFNLKAHDSNYKPQYITAERFKLIISSQTERGKGGRGKGGQGWRGGR